MATGAVPSLPAAVRLAADGADLTAVEHELGFRYELPGGGHYQDVCPRCRRALFGLAQGALWQQFLNAA